MPTSFNNLVKKLSAIANSFDETNNLLKKELLKSLSKLHLPKFKNLITYAEVLMFLRSHPANETLLTLTDNELKRISVFLKRNKEGFKKNYDGSGLPYSHIHTRFSHDLIHWLIEQKTYQLVLDSFADGDIDLSDILKLTLPAIERERTSSGFNKDELLQALHLKPNQTLQFIHQQLGMFNQQPLLKDYLFDGLEIYSKVSSNDLHFSRLYNRLQLQNVFFHEELIKKFDSLALLNSSLPAAKTLNDLENKALVSVIKNSLILTSRETDPCTYMEEKTLRLFELERGISVAIYGMNPERQLPLESYVGYTLFKNGYPAAYGGCWVFGQRSLFGINIFEPFRGGESGFMKCQILRVYRQVFGINYFEVEPYQFGKDNPDGIASGAFWFYHRYGFRPADKDILKLSEKEHLKIKTIKGYRSSVRTLKQLAESHIGLTLGKYHQLTVSQISEKVSAIIQKQYSGNRQVAIDDCIKIFLIKSNFQKELNLHEQSVLEEMSLCAAALKIEKIEQFDLLTKMIVAKPIDLYAYQNLLTRFLTVTN